YQEGPFATPEEAEAAARRWFLDNPAGPTAEVLAREPHDPTFRHLLLALNDGDPAAGLAFLDRCEEAGVRPELAELAARQLEDLGIWPVEAPGLNPPRRIGALPPPPVASDQGDDF